MNRSRKSGIAVLVPFRLYVPDPLQSAHPSGAVVPLHMMIPPIGTNPPPTVEVAESGPFTVRLLLTVVAPETVRVWLTVAEVITRGPFNVDDELFCGCRNFEASSPFNVCAFVARFAV